MSHETPSAEPAPEADSIPAPAPAPVHPSPKKPAPRPAPWSSLLAGKGVPVVLAGAVGSILLVGGLLVWHAESKVNKIALSASAKPVTVTTAQSKPYQPSRTYVGTIEPWLAASVGPQLVAAYIDTVLVRPGVVVKRGDVLATLDCRDATAQSQAVAMEARAIDARQKAMADESTRFQGLLAKNFVSPNDAQRKLAESQAESAQLEAQKAKLARSTLEVNDCVLRAPFDGEVATRTMDPGGFVRPGMSIVSVVDRSTVRYVTDVPEIDFDAVPPGTPLQIYIPSTKQEITAVISRRAPAADPATRTVHFEVDLVDDARRIPVGTTGEARLEVGTPEPATEIPIYAASVRGKKATVFVVEGDVAHTRTVEVKGELGGGLFVDESLAAGTRIVTEGRALLTDGDRVSAKVEDEAISEGHQPPSKAPSASLAAASGAPSARPASATVPAGGAKEHHQ